ncbi:MAG: hypothetical protein U1E48_04565 [Paracoccaceae bacterium]
MYVHFDPDAVERQLREVHRSMIAAAEQTKSHRQPFVQASARLFEPYLAAVLECVRMKNEGQAPAFISEVMANHIANLVVNTLSLCGDPAQAMTVIDQVVQKAITSVFGQGEVDGVSAARLEFVGTPGGRA